LLIRNELLFLRQRRCKHQRRKRKKREPEIENQKQRVWIELRPKRLVEFILNIYTFKTCTNSRIFIINGTVTNNVLLDYAPVVVVVYWADFRIQRLGKERNTKKVEG